MDIGNYFNSSSGKNAANLFDGFAGFFMVGAAGGHADDNVAVLHDARKNKKITFLFYHYRHLR